MRIFLKKATILALVAFANARYVSLNARAEESLEPIYIIKPETHEVDKAWSNWSWGADDLEYDDDNNIVTSFEKNKYGALSVRTEKEFNAGTIHFDAKINKSTGALNVIVHTTSDDEQHIIATLEKVSTRQLQSFDVKVPAIEDDSYNRISLQDAWNKALTLTINNFYFTPSETAQAAVEEKEEEKPEEEKPEEEKEEEEEKPATTSARKLPTAAKKSTTTSKKLTATTTVVAKTTTTTKAALPTKAPTAEISYIVSNEKEVDKAWTEKSFDVKEVKSNDDGEVTVTFESDKMGALSYLTTKKFNAGKIHFDAKLDMPWSAVAVAVGSSEDDKQVTLKIIENVAVEEFQTIEVEVPALEEGSYNRISIQDPWNKGVTLTIKNLYFTPIEAVEATETTEVAEATETATEAAAETTEATTTEVKTSTTRKVSTRSTTTRAITTRSTTSKTISTKTLPIETKTATATAIKTPSATDATYIISGEHPIDKTWMDWSWNIQNLEANDDGSLVVTFEPSKYGAFSVLNAKEFTAGTIHFEAKANINTAPINVMVHTTQGEELINLKTFQSVSTGEYQSFDVEVPAAEDDTYNRISIQNAWSRNLVLTINNFSFTPAKSTESAKPTTSRKLTTTVVKSTTTKASSAVKTPTASNVSYIVSGDHEVDKTWSDWSWNIENLEASDDGSLVATYLPGRYAAFSVLNNKEFTAGKIHFDAKVDKAGTAITVILHAVDSNELVQVKTFQNVSTTEMQSFDVEIPATEGSYNRISIQDSRNTGFVLTINNFYLESTESAKPATTAKKTTTTVSRRLTTSRATTTRTTTRTRTTKVATTTNKPATKTSAANATYIVSGEHEVDKSWNDWSWAVESLEADDEGHLVATFEPNKYGAFSVHTTKKFNAGTIHFEAKVDKANSPIVVLVHTTSDDKQITLQTIRNVSTTQFQSFDIKVPAVSNDTYNRISIQDAYGKAITLTIGNFYFTPSESAATTPKTGETKKATSGKIDILGDRETYFSDKWEDWSWDVDYYDFDAEGNFLTKFTRSKYGAISFKRKDNVEFGAGVLHFKAKANRKNAPLQILMHTVDDELVNAGIKVVSNSEMTEYTVEVPESDNGELYNRISIQDASNFGILLTITDIYYESN